ncbi:MAG TPA: non-ribosomal peptide synthetase, partial [Spongiibacteraceae bacterium]|nr:non-ribosomal peptide synthetase [Spongiibacteraceae bacterium]
LRDIVRDGRVINMYGPTETTIWSSCSDVQGVVSGGVPVGRPLVNQQFLVLDSRDQPLPPGVPGELVIGGDAVVPGYHRRPELSAERFPGLGTWGRCYRTGDLARWLPDGQLLCMGRRDHQIKIRGYRVELGEIEACLRQHPAVREAAVILREDRPGDQRLVAYVTAGEGQPVAQVLRDYSAQHLPEFMVPAAVVVMPALPLTPNGKIDRNALPAPREAAAATAAPRQPENAMQQLVAEIWQQALDLPAVGIHENFFDIGGHSLLVVQVLAALRQKLDRPLQMTDLFRYTTVASLAAFLADEDKTDAAGSRRGQSRAEARRAALQRRRR